MPARAMAAAATSIFGMQQFVRSGETGKNPTMLLLESSVVVAGILVLISGTVHSLGINEPELF